jgi:hypothetical protein
MGAFITDGSTWKRWPGRPGLKAWLDSFEPWDV